MRQITGWQVVQWIGSDWQRCDLVGPDHTVTTAFLTERYMDEFFERHPDEAEPLLSSVTFQFRDGMEVQYRPMMAGEEA